ncbi:MAG: type II and III secretion system protein family protein [Rhodovibrionaceae bacterium]
MLTRLTFAIVLFLTAWAGSSSAMAMEIAVNQGEVIRLPRPAASVFVANPEIADIQVMSPTLVYIFGKSAGETTLFAVDEEEEILFNRTIIITHNLPALRRIYADLLPGSNVKAQSVGAGILLTGSVDSPVEAEDAVRVASRYIGEGGDVINRLSVLGSDQVHLRVRVAEVSRTVNKDFGINWEAIGTVGDFTFGLATGDDIVIDALGNVLRSPDADNLFGSYSNSNLDINVLVDALAAEGLVTLLAEPNLTAMSGETASFLAGGEFPIPISQDDDGGISIEFKQFGVSLSFTPTLVTRNRINLRVRPEVSQLSQLGAVTIDSINIPALTTRRAETTVELGSGQSFAIAGLLQNTTRQSIDEFPILGDIPILGALFRSDNWQRDETELVIIVTPYLVKPVDDRQIVLPTDGFEPPDDVDRVLYGRTTGKQGTASPSVESAPLAPRGAEEQTASSPAAQPQLPVQQAPQTDAPTQSAEQRLPGKFGFAWD